MKKILTLLSVMLVAVSLHAQKYNMVIHHKGGELTTFSCDQIDEITFEEVGDQMCVPVSIVEEGIISLKVKFDMPADCEKFYVYYRPNQGEAPTDIAAEIKEKHQYEMTKGGEVLLNNVPCNTQYTVYTLALAAGGTEGAVAQASAKTQNPAQPLLQIKVDNITTDNAELTITPQFNDMTYVYTLNSKEGYDRDVETYGSAFAADIAWWRDIGSWSDPVVTWQEVMKTALNKGNKFITASREISGIKAGTEYILYCYGINTFGEVVSPLYQTLFTTAEAAMSDNQITVEILEVYSNGVDVKVTTTNNDRYYITAQKASSIDRHITDGQVDEAWLVDWLMSYPDNQSFMSGSKDLLHLNAKTADEPYYIIVFGYDGGQTTPVTLVPFHTL